MTELSDQFDDKVREQLRDVVEREQMMRLYQIRMQVRPVVESLANRYVVRRLELTDEQQQKVADLTKEMQAKQSELFGAMRGASDEQRQEAFQKPDIRGGSTPSVRGRMKRPVLGGGSGKLYGS
jgi:hypothetical protein